MLAEYDQKIESPTFEAAFFVCEENYEARK